MIYLLQMINTGQSEAVTQNIYRIQYMYRIQAISMILDISMIQDIYRIQAGLDINIFAHQPLWLVVFQSY